MSEGAGPSPFKYHLELTPAQLKLTHTALRSLLDDFGHDERGVHDVIRQVLDKLPDEHAIRAIRLDDEIERGIRDVKPDAAAPEQPSPPTIGGDPPDTVA
jgi:hypothetical protein